MRLSGRLSAAIEIISDFEARRVPLKTALADWARGARYAGAKDRAWISGLCLDILRNRQSLSAMMGDESPRAAVIACLHFEWAISLDDLQEALCEEPHGAGALTEPERVRLETPNSLDDEPLHVRANFPEWLAPNIERVFGADAVKIMSAFAERADVDLRLNGLKTESEKALSALKSVKAKPIPLLKNTARIEAPSPSEKAPAVTVIPAFNKGWVEVQDLGSQIAAAAAGEVKGAQVLDYCAGGGGKTLALAAMMENTGQLYAYDRDPRRLKPLFHRAKRAGVRNLQIRSPAGDEGLDDLVGKMDVVFVDAPCTGAGTWRRHPDTKWRLTEQQLQRQMQEQDIVLRQAAEFVKPGGRMIWVTCSFLMEENEDRLSEFLSANTDFSFEPVIDGIEASNLLSQEGHGAIKPMITPEGAIRLSPDKLRADGFFIATMRRAS
ncbi:RsmB/NOP family class I SAM-dependent RNA methyltransferase [Hyphococcus formosus]|uniref:RsmB/NOP family class I SAM-dependent RNA methyltransferase n=1 Tax=Hyphococcus formosus TaxID=3143534 RepID=UPI00398B1E6D